MSTLLGAKGLKSFGRYSAVGLELLISIAVGYYGGHWLDGKFGTRWIAFIGFLLGCYAGFRALFRTAKAMQKDIERDEMIERGEDPWAEKDKSSGDVSAKVAPEEPAPIVDDEEDDDDAKREKARKAKEKAGYL